MPAIPINQEVVNKLPVRPLDDENNPIEHTDQKPPKQQLCLRLNYADEGHSMEECTPNTNDINQLQQVFRETTLSQKAPNGRLVSSVQVLMGGYELPKKGRRVLDNAQVLMSWTRDDGLNVPPDWITRFQAFFGLKPVAAALPPAEEPTTGTPDANTAIATERTIGVTEPAAKATKRSKKSDTTAVGDTPPDAETDAPASGT